MVALFYIFILSTLCSIKKAGFVTNQGDKVVLSPAEIIDMVIKENSKQNNLHAWRKSTIRLSQPLPIEHSVTESSESDERILKDRKMWSRWGKWGECSVTCGEGTKRRQRVCVSGRCSAGEREEQSRPCARSPCGSGYHEID